MRRHLPRLLLLGALLSPVTLYALGLGEIRLHSALNQPFDAEIELISPTADELAGLKVGLASPDLYSRYGIDRPIYLTSFTFSVQRTRDGRAAIKVASNRSVTEPFVTILVEASWARGRLLREYTVLLDPPVFMPSQPEAQAPVTTPQTGTQQGRIERQVAQQPPAETPSPRTTPLPTPSEPTQEPVTSASASGAPLDGEYTVERNDTLWRIASRVTPGGSRREINRTMIAVFRANPAAFNGNINRLRSGAVLRIPELSDIEAISTGEATAEVARQAAEWSGAQPSQVAQEEANRLRLVTPEETPVAPSSATPAPEQVAKAPTTAPTTSGPTPQDNRVALPSQGLAETQQGATETPVEAAPQAETTQEPTAQQTEPAAETPPSTEAAAPQRPVTRPPVQAPTEPSPSLLDRVNQYWWVLVLLGLLVVIGLAVAFVRRRREEASLAVDSMAGLDFEPRATRAAPAMSPVTKARDRDSFVVEDSDDDDTLGGLDEPAPTPTARRAPEPTRSRVEPVAAAPAASPRIDDTISSETQVRFDQQDALAEADFHMAYGLYDQAADLVKIAISREGGRRDLKLKLLEIYFVWGNKDLFLDTARELHSTRAQAAPGEWDKVLIMGKQIAPDDAMFKGEAGAAHVDLVDVNLEGGENRVDVDLFAEPDEKPAGLDLEFTSGERKAPRSAGASSDLDFLLDEPKRGSDEEPTREFDPLSRTQETPTIETPQIDRSSQTLRERTIREKASKAEQTAELSLDDLGLDVDSIDSGSLEDTTSLEKDATAESPTALRDDEMTQLAPSISNFDRTMKAPRDKFDIETTGTIYIDQVDLAGGDTVEQPRPETDSTAEMKRPSSKDLDVDLDHLSGSGSGPETVRQTRGADREVDTFSSDVFADRTAEVPRVDLDVGEPLSGDDGDTAHRRTLAGDVGLSELEPVTMSEVGTKLDLARAYMDMGDPDGARSILEEVLSEGNASQKQEAQRLMESIR